MHGALGAARWRRLHRLVYAIGPLAVLHFFWMRSAKHNFGEVAVYAAVISALLADWPEARDALAKKFAVPPGRKIVSVFRMGRPKGQARTTHARLPVDELLSQVKAA